MSSSNKIADDLKAKKINYDYLKNSNMDIAELVKMARKNKPGAVQDDDSDGSYYEEIIEEEVIEDDLSLLRKPLPLPSRMMAPKLKGKPKPKPPPVQKQKPPKKKKKKKEVDGAKLLLLQSAEQKITDASKAFKEAVKEGAAIVSLLETMLADTDWDEDDIEEVDPNSWDPRTSFDSTIEEARSILNRLESARHDLMGTRNKGGSNLDISSNTHGSFESLDSSAGSPQSQRKFVPPITIHREPSFKVPDLATLQEEDTDRQSSSEEEQEPPPPPPPPPQPTTKKASPSPSQKASPAPAKVTASPQKDEMAKAKQAMLQFAKEGTALASKLSPAPVKWTRSVPKLNDEMAKAKQAMLQFAKEGTNLASKLEKKSPAHSSAKEKIETPPPLPIEMPLRRTSTTEEVFVEEELADAKSALLQFAKEGAELASKLKKKGHAEPEALTPTAEEKDKAPVQGTDGSKPEKEVESSLEKEKIVTMSEATTSTEEEKDPSQAKTDVEQLSREDAVAEKEEEENKTAQESTSAMPIDKTDSVINEVKASEDTVKVAEIEDATDEGEANDGDQTPETLATTNKEAVESATEVASQGSTEGAKEDEGKETEEVAKEHEAAALSGESAQSATKVEPEEKEQKPTEQAVSEDVEPKKSEVAQEKPESLAEVKSNVPCGETVGEEPRKEAAEIEEDSSAVARNGEKQTEESVAVPGQSERSPESQEATPETEASLPVETPAAIEEAGPVEKRDPNPSTTSPQLAEEDTVEKIHDSEQPGDTSSSETPSVPVAEKTEQSKDEGSDSEQPSIPVSSTDTKAVATNEGDDDCGAVGVSDAHFTSARSDDAVGAPKSVDPCGVSTDPLGEATAEESSATEGPGVDAATPDATTTSTSTAAASSVAADTSTKEGASADDDTTDVPPAETSPMMPAGAESSAVAAGEEPPSVGATKIESSSAAASNIEASDATKIAEEAAPTIESDVTTASAAVDTPNTCATTDTPIADVDPTEDKPTAHKTANPAGSPDTAATEVLGGAARVASTDASAADAPIPTDETGASEAQGSAVGSVNPDSLNEEASHDACVEKSGSTTKQAEHNKNESPSPDSGVSTVSGDADKAKVNDLGSTELKETAEVKSVTEEPPSKTPDTAAQKEESGGKTTDVSNEQMELEIRSLLGVGTQVEVLYAMFPPEVVDSVVTSQHGNNEKSLSDLPTNGKSRAGEAPSSAEISSNHDSKHNSLISAQESKDDTKEEEVPEETDVDAAKKEILKFAKEGASLVSKLESKLSQEESEEEEVLEEEEVIEEVVSDDDGESRAKALAATKADFLNFSKGLGKKLG